MRNEENAYQSWLWGEVLLFGLLGAALALFVAYPDLRPTFELPQVRLVLDTMVVFWLWVHMVSRSETSPNAAH